MLQICKVFFFNYLYMKLTDLKKLCSPAKLYLSLSLLVIISLLFQNMNNKNMLCVGSFECYSQNKSLLLLVKVLYVVFWTFVLNLMCRGGYSSFAWFLVGFPLVLFFVLVALYMVSKGSITEGLDDKKHNSNTNSQDHHLMNNIKQSLHDLKKTNKNK